MSVKISGVMKDAMGKPIPDCTIALKALHTTATVITKTVGSLQPEDNGSYSMDVELGKYSVTLCVEGYPPNDVGEIYVHSESVPGTLNYYLGLPTEGDLPPAAIQQFEAMVELVSQQAAQVEKDKAAAAASAKAAKLSETNANTSETNAGKSAAAALVSEKAAKTSETNTAKGIEAAAASAQAAKLSENNADGSKKAAQASATEALASQGAAKTSETNAGNSAKAASGSADKAKSEADRATAATDGKQDKNALLTAIAALNTAADQIITLTGKNSVATAVLTKFAKEMLAKTDAAGVREYLGLSATLNKNTQAGTQHGWAAGNFDDNYYSVFGFSKHNTVSAKKSFNDMPANSSWFGYQTSENPPTPAFNGIFADFAGSSESYRMQLGGKYIYNNGRCLFSLRTLDGDHNSWNPWVVMLTSLPSSSSPTNTNENPLYPSSAFEGGIEAVGGQENVSDTFGMLRVRNKNNTVMGSCYNERGGDWTLAVSTNGISGTEKYYQFLKTGQFVSPGNISCISLTQTCDIDAKYDIETIDDPLSKLDKVNGYTYKFRDTDLPSAGIIAQEFKEILPDIISTKAEPIPQYNEDGDFIGLKANDDLSNLTYGVEPMGVIGFLVAALKAEKSEREKLSRALADLKGKVDLLLSKE